MDHGTPWHDALHLVEELALRLQERTGG